MQLLKINPAFSGRPKTDWSKLAEKASALNRITDTQDYSGAKSEAYSFANALKDTNLPNLLSAYLANAVRSAYSATQANYDKAFKDTLVAGAQWSMGFQIGKNYQEYVVTQALLQSLYRLYQLKTGQIK